MFHGLYRRLMVKILDKGFTEAEGAVMAHSTKKDIEILKESGVSYQYFGDMKSFEKSNISTTCEYVICPE
jgi:hypothetical protein